MPSSQDSPEPAKIGICLSGGGIRSAAFSLGAIQALQLHLGLLKGPRSATYLSAVSGGSYTAAAFALVAGGPLDTPSIGYSRQRYHQRTGTDEYSPDGHPLPNYWDEASSVRRRFPWLMRRYVKKRKSQLEKPVERQRKEGWVTIQPTDPLMPGSAESDFIRRHARYMMEPSSFSTIISFLTLIVVNIIFVISLVAWWGLAFGTLNRFVGIQSFDLTKGTFHADPNSNVITVAQFAGLGLIYVFVFTVMDRREKRRKWSQNLTDFDVGMSELLGLALVFWFLFVLGQFVPQLLYELTKGDAGEFSLQKLSSGLAAGIGAIGILGPSLIGVARARVVSLPKSLTKGSTRLMAAGKTLLYRVLQLLVALILPSLLLLAFFGSWLFAATTESATDPVLVAGALLFYYAMYLPIGGWQNVVSLFGPYRSKLSQAFDVVRQVRGDDIRARQRLITPTLSKLRCVADIPELLICASANLSELGTAAAGAYARSIVFSPRSITIPGEDGASLDTAGVETLLSQTNPVLTRSGFDGSVLSCVAMTGAAISPTMGKFTRTWLRGLMGFLNLRLGIWMPNPASEQVRSAVNSPQERGAKKFGRATKLRLFVREMRGKHYLNARFIYVSDGGHYENLGLVELIRRRCTEVWCIDASGDPPGTAVSLAESLTIITSELGLDVDVDLSSFEVDTDASELNFPVIRRVWNQGSIRAQFGSGSYVCKVHIVKLGMDSETSSRIGALRRRYRKFPYDSTLNQLYTAERFDLYRDLGFDSTRRAISASEQGSCAKLRDIPSVEAPLESNNNRCFANFGKRLRSLFK
jgi:hypothetical protein